MDEKYEKNRFPYHKGRENREMRKRIITLNGLIRGEEGIVYDLDGSNEEILKKLLAMGVLPGMKIKLLQKYPGYIFQIDQTKLAVDDKIAEKIKVVIKS